MVMLDGQSLTLEEVIGVAREHKEVGIKSGAKEAVKISRDYVEKIVEEERVVYGITTGFGKFSNVVISKDEVEELQASLIRSHACGVGPDFNEEIVRAIMLLRANTLTRGVSGIRLSTIETLVHMLNKNVIPAIPEKGSLGASGDLAPLAHMALVLMGEGEAYYEGIKMSGAEAMEKAKIKPVILQAKEGLALINGTQVLTAVGAMTTYDAMSLMEVVEISASLTFEALRGITDALHPLVHEARGHEGQIQCAKQLRHHLQGSKLVTRQGDLRVQDAYTLRCLPQILGATKDALSYIKSKIEIEINAVTDNPLIFSEEDLVISGGNFHGQPLALVFDYLGIAIAEVANSCERRIERLVNPSLSGLPAFLTAKGGLHSGFMIAQYSAAALVSENKVLAHPASVDSIPSSANQEDHVSMGTIAARKARDILENTSNVVAIELIAAVQAIEFQLLATYGDVEVANYLGRGTKRAYACIRQHITPLVEDRIMYTDFKEALKIIKEGTLLKQLK